MKLTDDEMSRILTAHAGGQLQRGDAVGFFRLEEAFCAMQAAGFEWSRWEAEKLNRPVSDWFEKHYERTWTPEQLIAAFTKAGIY